MSTIDRNIIVLNRPQMGENIGAVARAMANFSLTQLRIVNPRDGWPNQSAIKTASGAFDFIKPTEIFDSLNDALADIHYSFATTARNRDMNKLEFTPQSAVAKAQSFNKDEKVAFVFGQERTGLENDEIASCHALLTIPTHPHFSSLNLGQSVLVLAYALSEFTVDTPENINQDLASLQEFNGMFERLQNSLDDYNFFKEPNLRPKTLRNIKNMLLRADLSPQEVKTMHGIISALTKGESS